MLFSPASQTATTPQERHRVMEAYAGEVSPMMCFEADLQVVRASSADGEGLNASRWALAEAAIVADISAAVEEDLDSYDEFSDGADDGPDTFDELDDGRGEGAGEGGGSRTTGRSTRRSTSNNSKTQYCVR